MRTIKIICAILLPGFCLAQAVTFKKYELPNVGYISIPDNMEILSDFDNQYLGESIKEFVEKKTDLDIPPINRITFLSKRTNIYGKSGQSFAKVSVETAIGSNLGDYKKLTEKFTTTQAEINELSEAFKTQFKQLFTGTDFDVKLIAWYGVSITKVNGMPAMKTSYLYQNDKNPYIIVDSYLFTNSDRMHRLELSYRQSEEATWKSLFSKVLNSFTITNVR